MAKVRINFNPEKWDSTTLQHIKAHKPPAALWSIAIPTLINRKLGVDPFAFWWTDLSIYDPTLKGWKLNGKGERVSGVLMPGEKVYETTFSGVRSIKIGSEEEFEFDLPEPEIYDPDKISVDPHPGSLDLPEPIV